MQKTVLRWVGSSSLVLTAILASACNDAPLAPGGATTKAPRVTAAADVSDGNRLPDLTGCEKLGAPVGSTLLLHGYGIGVQFYHLNGTTWGSATPSATIFADQAGTGKLADHFGGPTWQSNSGGKVVGKVAERCTVDQASIQWLSLTGVADGPGIFADVNFIQRLNTVGGNAPSTPGSIIGQEARIPYTADYLFYKAP